MDSGFNQEVDSDGKMIIGIKPGSDLLKQGLMHPYRIQEVDRDETRINGYKIQPKGVS